MSAFASEPGLDDIRDAAGHGTEVDVAVHLHDGTVRLSILWTQEILLNADDAEQVAQALRRAAEQARRITAIRGPGRSTKT
jgi:4-aminobutyrate aminotransferase-like enzyme